MVGETDGIGKRIYSTMAMTPGAVGGGLKGQAYRRSVCRSRGKTSHLIGVDGATPELVMWPGRGRFTVGSGFNRQAYRCDGCRSR